MKKFTHYFSVVALAIVMFFTPCLVNFINTDNTKPEPQTRTVSASSSSLDYQSVLNEFEDGILETEGTLTTFEGYKTLDLADFAEFDEVSISDMPTSTEARIKYNFSYDAENGLVTLSAQMENALGEISVDEIYGVAFYNEQGEIDAVLDLDGEYMLLSEMQELGLIQNCGWFRNLFRKVAIAVATVVVVAAVAAAVVATCGAGLGACVAAGAVAGAVTGGAAGAIISKQETGQVQVGAVLGGIAAGAAIGALTGLAVGSAMGAGSAASGAGTATSGAGGSMSQTAQLAQNAGKTSKSVQYYDSYNKFKTAQGSASKYVTNGEWHHIVEQQTVTKGINGATSVYNTENTVAISKNLHHEISKFYSTSYRNLGMTFREYVNTLTYEQQYAEGIKILTDLAQKLGETIFWL